MKFLAYIVLLISILLPALISLFVFFVLWWYCIRPTLYYRRVYGRGPLVRVETNRSNQNHQWQNCSYFDSANFQTENDLMQTELYDSVGVEEHSHRSKIKQLIFKPNSNLWLISNPNVHSDLLSYSPSSLLDLNTANMYSPVLMDNHTSRDDEDGADNEINDDHNYINVFGFRCRRKFFNSKKMFSLKPRRIARLPPTLPASFIFVAFLYFMFGKFGLF